MLALALSALLALPLTDTTDVAGLVVLDPRLAREIHSLTERSPTFQSALLEIGDGSVPVFVGTPAQIRPILPGWDHSPESVARALAIGWRDEAQQAELTGSGGDGRSIGALQVLVIIDLDNMLGTYGALAADPATLRNDLDVMLAHEIAGHARGWSRTGQLHEGCLDPVSTEVDHSRATGCAVDVENAVRDELGLPVRRSYAESALSFRYAAALDLAYGAPLARTPPAPPPLRLPQNPDCATR
jgi:hypothetical protein